MAAPSSSSVPRFEIGNFSIRSGEKRRRKRLPVSCGECRKKKLSCDRALPCYRCVRSGQASTCSFEGVPEGGKPVRSRSHFSDKQAEEIQGLRTEIARLKEIQSQSQPQLQPQPQLQQGGAAHSSSSSGIDLVWVYERTAEEPTIPHAPDSPLINPKDRSPRGYYSQHALFKFFQELPQLFPFIKEVSDVWLKPRGAHLKKNKVAPDTQTSYERALGKPLEDLLPPRQDADVLVNFYIGHLEQLHHVLHIPTFKREYTNYWASGSKRYPAMTALILCMSAVSVCAAPNPFTATSVPSGYRHMPEQWISTCDDWLRDQSSKQRKLVHYQISCILYLAKRMNLVKKKKFWMETGSMIQNAMMDGLHYDPAPSESVYMTEMKRRIWTVLRELDIQNAYEFGLPTLLHNIDSDVTAPANLDDEGFYEQTKQPLTPIPQSVFTRCSWQVFSSHSWQLRLEISQSLHSGGVSKALDYDDVLRYTQDLTQEISSLPSWDKDDVYKRGTKQLPVLTHAFLQFQLIECILAIHRPYLKTGDGKYWLSENVSYQMARDVLLLNKKLSMLNLQPLVWLRDDLLHASLSLVRITMLQPKDSSSIMTMNAEPTIDLLKQCLLYMEEHYLRMYPGEPWCFMTMSAGIMLLQMHLGKESLEKAKSVCGERFLHLYFQHPKQRPQPSLDQARQTTKDSKEKTHTQALSVSELLTPSTTTAPPSTWLDGDYPDVNIDPFDIDVDLDTAWESWGFV